MNIDKKFLAINVIFLFFCSFAIFYFARQYSRQSIYSGKLLCQNRLEPYDSINLYDPHTNSIQQIYTTPNLILKTIQLSGQIFSLEKTNTGETQVRIISESSNQVIHSQNRFIHDIYPLPQSQRLLLLTQGSFKISGQNQPAYSNKIELYNPKSRIFTDIFPQPPQPVQNIIIHPIYDIIVYKNAQEVAHYYDLNNKTQTILGHTNYLYGFDKTGTQILAQQSPNTDQPTYPTFQIFQSNQQTKLFQQQARYRDAIIVKNSIYASKAYSTLPNGESLYQIIRINFSENQSSETTIFNLPDFSLEYPQLNNNLQLLAFEKIPRSAQLNLNFKNSRYHANTLRSYQSELIIFNLNDSTIQHTFPCRQPLWL
jgi:hypothetical protein